MPTTTTTTVPPAFVVRAERNGADEAYNFSMDVCSIHWERCPDPFRHPYQALVAWANSLPYGPTITLPNAPRMIWQFAHDIDEGALIVLPRLDPTHNEEVALGWARGSAYYVPEAADAVPNLRRRVDWVATDLPRRAFSEATQIRFNHPRDTVSLITRQDVVDDILAVLAARHDHEQQQQRQGQKP